MCVNLIFGDFAVVHEVLFAMIAAHVYLQQSQYLVQFN
jgi:hypothetical protein